jgi:type I restriction enzyme, S subunit
LSDQWSTRKAGELFVNRKEKGKEDAPMFSVSIQRGLIKRTDIDKRTETSLRGPEHLLVKPGDLAYNTMRMWQGALGFAKHEGNVSPSYVVITPTTELDSEFAYYYFKTPRAMYLLWSYSYGLTNDRLRLYFKDFAKVPIHLPPLWEQRKIAQALRTWDNTIDNLEALLEKKRSYYSLIARSLFEQCHPTFNDRSTRFREYELGDVFQERNEPGGENDDLLSITMAEGVIHRGDVGRKDTSAIDKSRYKLIAPSDIGYNTMRMWQGISGLSTLRGVISPAYTVVTPISDKIDARYAAHLFKSRRMVFDFQRYSQGLTSDTWNLKFPAFAKIRVFLPPLPDQINQRNALDAINQEIELIRRRIKVCEAQKQGLMQKLLTGEWRFHAVTPDKTTTEQDNDDTAMPAVLQPEAVEGRK